MSKIDDLIARAAYGQIVLDGRSKTEEPPNREQTLRQIHDLLTTARRIERARLKDHTTHCYLSDACERLEFLLEEEKANENPR